MYTELLKSNFKFWNIFKTWKIQEWDISPYHGLWFFDGQQGQGKSLTMVRLIKALKTDINALSIISNVDLQGMEYTPYTGVKELIRVCSNVKGAVVVIDECNILFPSTDKPDPFFLHFISLLRKNELICLMTCQVFTRCSKFLREQAKLVTSVKIPFKGFSYNVTYKVDYDKMLTEEDSGNVKSALVPIHTQFFFHSLEDYNLYDTKANIFLKEFK